MCEVALRMGTWNLHWYTPAFVAGTLTIIVVAAWELKQRAEDPLHAAAAAAFMFPLGLLGARPYHVFTVMPGRAIDTHTYLEHPELIWQGAGGLGTCGAFAGMPVGLWLYACLARWRFLWASDILALGIRAGHAIGRWGSVFNQELYGPPTNLPWGIYIDPAHRYPAYASLRQPTPVLTGHCEQSPVPSQPIPARRERAMRRAEGLPDTEHRGGARHWSRHHLCHSKWMGRTWLLSLAFSGHRGQAGVRD